MTNQGQFAGTRVLRGQGRTTKEEFLKVSKFGVLSVSAIAALSVATPGFSGGNKYDAIADQRVCEGGDVVNWLGATTLWPPNHKMQSSTVAAVGDDATEGVTLTIRPVVTDAAGGDGGAQHDPDYMWESSPANTGQGVATVDNQLRAERSGRGEGRIYTVHFTAMFDDGAEECTSEDGSQAPFVVTVPHDMRDKNN